MVPSLALFTLLEWDFLGDVSDISAKPAISWQSAYDDFTRTTAVPTAVGARFGK